MSCIANSLSPALLEAAARWYVQLADQPDNAAEREAWQAWLKADPLHREAWARMQALEQRLGGVPGDIVRPTLDRAGDKRRRTLQLLTLLMSVGAAGLVARESTSLRTYVADHGTRTGERRQVRLADGGVLNINTASAVDIEYTESQRLLRLYQGEILIQTAADPTRRPFAVETPQGRIVALGTRFNVRSEDGQTRVTVLEHAVEVTPKDALQTPLRIEAGELAMFTALHVEAPETAPAGVEAWASGKLIAIDQPLGEFLQELTRHRSGVLLCDPLVANLRLSGSFRLGDTDAILDNLVASLPVKVRHVTRYWARVEPR
jgi:transmembrane sensor